jgi:hypothetical protein
MCFWNNYHQARSCVHVLLAYKNYNLKNSLSSLRIRDHNTFAYPIYVYPLELH